MTKTKTRPTRDGLAAVLPLDDAEAFFFENCAYGYDPATETQAEGLTRCAIELAAAERFAEASEWAWTWEIDQDVDSSDFSDDEPPWSLWSCFLWEVEDHPAPEDLLQSLHGIDFGRDGEPWDEAYKRVVEAELALEAMSNA
jgi:hypothetical protein